MTDESLMASYIAGDDSAFGMIYQKHSGKVYAYLRKKLKTPQEVEEVFQASFLKFHRVRARYRSSYPVSQWLFVIVRSTLIDHYRAQKRQNEIADLPIEGFSDSYSKNPADSAPTQEEVTALLDQLPANQRETVKRRILDEQTYQEIALSLNRSETSIRQTLSRALRKMKTGQIPKPRRNE